MTDLSAEDILQELWKEHSRVRAGFDLGMGTPFQTFWCESCSQPYPCATARSVVRWGTLNPEYEFLSLRAPVKGEVVSPNGRSVKVGGHSWAVNGAVPTLKELED